MSRKIKLENKQLLKKGNVVSISTNYYAKEYNNFLNKAKINKEKYDKETINEHINSGKKSRPILVMETFKWSKKIIAVPLSSSNTETNKKECFVLKKNFSVKNRTTIIYPTILIFDYTKADIYPDRIVYKKIGKNSRKKYLEWLEKNELQTYTYYLKNI